MDDIWPNPTGVGVSPASTTEQFFAKGTVSTGDPSAGSGLAVAGDTQASVREALDRLCLKCGGWGRISIFAAVGDKVVRKSAPCKSCNGNGLRQEQG